MRMGSGEGSTMRNFIVCTVHLIIVRVIKSRRLRWAGHVARIERKSTFKLLTGKPTRMKHLRRPRLRLEVRVKMDFKEIHINTMNFVDFAQDKDN